MTMPFLPTRKLRARKFPAARCTALFAAITALFFVVALGNSANAQSTNYWRNVAGNGLWANDDGSGINNWFRASDGWDVRRGDLSNGQWSATSTPKSYNILIFDNGTQATTTVNAIGGAKYHVAEIRLANSTDRTFNSSDGGYLAMSNASGVAKIESVSGGTGTYTFNVPILFEENTEINAVNGNLVFGSSSTITNNSFTLISYTSSGRTAAFNGVISGSGGLEHKGDGLVTLGAVNTYTGATTVEGAGGAIQIENASALGGTAAGTTVSSGAALNVFNVSGTINEGLTLNGTGVSSGGALRNVSGNNTWGGGITLASASRINSDSGTLTIDPTSGNAISGSFNLTLGGAGNININDPIATGSGTLTKDGTGQVNLAGVNTYTGTTTVSAGSLEAQSASALGTTANGTTVSAGAALRLWNNTGVTFDAEALSLVGTGVGDIGALYNAGGANTWQGNITLTGGTRIGAVTSSSLTLSGTIDLATANTLYIGGAGNFTIGNNFLNAGKTTADGAIFWDGTGTLRLNQATQSALTGNINLRSGTVLLGAANALGSGAITASAGSTLTLASADTTARSIGNNVTLAGNLTLGQATTGTGAVTLGGTLSLGATRTITVNNNLATISGAVSGATFGLTKAGTGTLVLSSASSSYSGATTVNAGTLEFNGSNTSTTTTVASGGTLAGTGTLAGVTVQNGGRIGAGASGGIGNLGVSALTLEASGGYNWELGNVTGTAGTNWDLITVGAGGGGTINANAVTSGSPFTIFITGNPTGWNPANSGSWTIMNGGSITGFAANKFIVNTTGFGGTLTSGTWSFADNSGELVLSYNAPASEITVIVNSGAVDQGAPSGITGGAAQFTGPGLTLVKSGAGTLIMTNGANNYTGGTTIAEGAISIIVASPNGAAGALGDSTAAVNVGTSGAAVAAGFDFGAAVENQRALQIVAGNGAGGTRAITTSFGAGTATQSGGVTVGTNTTINAASGSTLLISGNLTGGASAALNITGSGATVLSGNSTAYSGPITNASTSTLRVGHNSGLGTGALTLNGGTFAAADGTARTLGNNITLGGNVTLGDATGTGDLTLNGTVALNGATRTLNVGNNTTLGGAISGAAGNGLTKSGSGTLTLSGVNTFSGAATVSAGQLNLSGGSAIADGTAVTVSSGAVLGVNAQEEIGSLAGAGNVSLGANLLIAGGNNTTTSYSGVMSGTGGFVKKGSGVMTLSTGYTYSGQTYIVGGTLLYNAAPGTGGTGIINIGEENSTGLASTFAIGGSGLTIGNNINVRAGDADTATIDAQNTTGTTTLNGSLTLGKNADIRAASGGGLLVNGNITGNFTIGKRGAGTATIAGTTAGGTKFDLWEGELQIGSADNLGNSGTLVNNKIYFDSGTLGATGTFTIGANNGMFVGGGGANFRVASANTLTVAGIIDNTATNVITKLGDGTLTLTSTSNSGNNRFDLLAGELQVSAVGNLGDKTGAFLGNKLFFNGGTLGVTGNVDLDGENGVTLGGNGTIRVTTGNTLTLQGYINDGELSGLTLSKTGAGTLFFSKEGVNDFNGTTLVINEGTVSTWNPGLMPAAIQLGSATAATSGTYRFDKGDGAVTAANNFTVNSGGGAITVAADPLTLSGSISGSGALSKTGTGSLSLTGNSGYSGALTVSAGTLQLNRTGGASLGSVGSINVAGTATLLVSQTSQVNNDQVEVTLSGGTITRGSGVSEVFGNLNVSAASFLNFGSGTAGSIEFGTYTRDTGSALLTVQNFFQGNSLVFSQNLVDLGYISASSTGSFNNGYFAFADGFNTTWNGTDTFTITAIPEPSTYLAAAGLLAMFLWPVRRRLIKDAKSILGLRATGRDRIEGYRNA